MSRSWTDCDDLLAGRRRYSAAETLVILKSGLHKQNGNLLQDFSSGTTGTEFGNCVFLEINRIFLYMKWRMVQHNQENVLKKHDKGTILCCTSSMDPCTPPPQSIPCLCSEQACDILSTLHTPRFPDPIIDYQKKAPKSMNVQSNNYAKG